MKVKGMHCKSCEVLLSDVVEELGGKAISSDFKKGTIVAEFPTNPNREKIKEAFKTEGYSVEGFS